MKIKNSFNLFSNLEEPLDYVWSFLFTLLFYTVAFKIFGSANISMLFVLASVFKYLFVSMLNMYISEITPKFNLYLETAFYLILTFLFILYGESLISTN